MRISHQTWLNYIKKLDAIDSKAADMMQEWVEANGLEDRQALVEYAYALTTKYGEAAAALACEMYDATALASGVTLPAAVPAETPTIEEVGRAVNGSLRHSQVQVPSTVYRLTKQSAADTTLQNAARDGAQFAWIPYGDTCPFCITLASRGWQYMSKKALKGGHAEHIHANCDCQYGVRFSEKDSVAGYDPKVYEDMYYGAEGSTPQERINSMRRARYQQNRDHINEMKRAAYARRRTNIDTPPDNDRIKLRLNYFDKNDPLYIESFSIEEESGFEDVCGHGNSSHFEVTINGVKTPMTAEQFADHITKNGDYKGQDLRFVSCSVAEGDNSFAQELSRILGNTVKGPNMDAYYAPEEGTVFIGSPYSNIGKWRIFKNGEELK